MKIFRATGIGAITGVFLALVLIGLPAMLSAGREEVGDAVIVLGIPLVLGAALAGSFLAASAEGRQRRNLQAVLVLLILGIVGLMAVGTTGVR
jgi:hypothetical protein